MSDTDPCGGDRLCQGFHSAGDQQYMRKMDFAAVFPAITMHHTNCLINTE